IDRYCTPFRQTAREPIIAAVAQHTTVTTIVPSSGDQLFLVVVGDRVIATEALPSVGSVVIGRAPGCELRIDETSISRDHAGRYLDRVLQIVDTQSANGIWIDDQRIAPNEAVEIRLDQVVRLGSVTIIVQRRPAPVPQPRRLRTHEYFVSRIEDECDRARTFTI